MITPENLIDSLDALGPWSQHTLAEQAIIEWFPEIEDLDPFERTLAVTDKMQELGLTTYGDVIERYHKEKGYQAEDMKGLDHL